MAEYGTRATPDEQVETGETRDGASASFQSGSNEGQIDWSKTGWNIGDGNQSGEEWYSAPDNTYGFQIGGNVGYLDPATGLINYGTGTLARSGDTSDSPIYKTLNTEGQSQYQYDVGSDYGLGSEALGIIPMQHDATGQVSQYVTAVEGGGYGTFTDLASAKEARDAYLAWQPTTKEGQAEAAANPTTTTTDTATETEPGILTVPGQGEEYFADTKDLYGQKTNAQKLAEEELGTTNSQKVFDETTNQPSDAEQQWNAYSGIYSNPDYLKDYYAQAEQRAQTTLDRKAASGGWGDSGAAAKATGNLGAVYGEKAITGMGDFATTGMGLATASDTGRTQRTDLYGSLAGAADDANQGQDSIATTRAANADDANLSYLTGGQTAANQAENLLIDRETGGLDSATKLANDQSDLVAAGLDSATSEKYSTELAALEVEWEQAGLTASQQYAEAEELAKSMGVVASAAFTSWLTSKYGAKKA